MTVVAAGELDNLMATRVATGEADGGHRGLGTAISHADLLHRGDAGEEELGHLDLERVGGAETRTAIEGLPDRGTDIGVVMAVDGRTPGQDEINQLLVVGRRQVGTVGRFSEKRRSSDRTKGPDGGIDAARNHREGALEELLRGIHGGI